MAVSKRSAVRMSLRRGFAESMPFGKHHEKDCALLVAEAKARARDLLQSSNNPKPVLSSHLLKSKSKERRYSQRVLRSKRREQLELAELVQRAKSFVSHLNLSFLPMVAGEEEQLFIVQIDTNCGVFPEPRWEDNSDPQPLDSALIEAQECRNSPSRFPARIVPEGFYA